MRRLSHQPARDRSKGLQGVGAGTARGLATEKVGGDAKREDAGGSRLSSDTEVSKCLLQWLTTRLHEFLPLLKGQASSWLSDSCGLPLPALPRAIRRTQEDSVHLQAPGSPAVRTLRWVTRNVPCGVGPCGDERP